MPPVGRLCRMVTEPEHTPVLRDRISTGNASTVNVLQLKHFPQRFVFCITDHSFTAPTAVIRPVLFIVATVASLLLHTPSGVEVVNNRTSSGTNFISTGY